MITTDENFRTFVYHGGGGCHVEVVHKNIRLGDPPLVMAISGVRVDGVHAKRLRAAINTAQPDTDAKLRQAVGRHLIPQVTGEVAERILRACYD